MSPRLLRPRASGKFTPRSLASLAGWWDASLESSVTLNGSTVSSWADRSGNGRDALQSTAANQPTYSQTQNGLKVISFDGASQFLRGSWELSLTGQTTFAVAFVSDINGFGRLFTQTTTTNGTPTGTPNTDSSISGHYIPLLRNSSNPAFISWRDSGTRAQVSVSSGTWNIWSSVFSGTTISNALNNGTPATHTTSALNTTFHTFGIGSGLPPNFGNASITGGWFGGRIAEVVSYSRALSATEIASVAAYLKQKWATP